LASFEESLTKLEAIVAKTRGGDLNLEIPCASSRKAPGFPPNAGSQLEEAEGKVELLVKQPRRVDEREPFGS